MGLPLYVQASDQGRRLYLHHGFNELGREEFDLEKFGLRGLEVMTEMIRQPSNTAKRSLAPVLADT